MAAGSSCPAALRPGEMLYDGDILTDFPQEREFATIMFAERASAEESLHCDMLPFEARSPEPTDPVRDGKVALS